MARVPLADGGACALAVDGAHARVAALAGLAAVPFWPPRHRRAHGSGKFEIMGQGAPASLNADRHAQKFDGSKIQSVS